MTKILGIERKPQNVGVTTHAKQRLYDRFESLCVGRGDFAVIITDAFCDGDVISVCDERRTVIVLFGNIRIVAIALMHKFTVVTILNEQTAINYKKEYARNKKAHKKFKAMKQSKRQNKSYRHNRNKGII